MTRAAHSKPAKGVPHCTPCGPSAYKCTGDLSYGNMIYAIHLQAGAMKVCQPIARFNKI